MLMDATTLMTQMNAQMLDLSSISSSTSALSSASTLQLLSKCLDTDSELTTMMSMMKT